DYILWTRVQKIVARSVICARMHRQRGTMMMAKPTTELAKRCKPPPYTHWDQRGEKPVLLSDLNLIDGDRKCKRLSFQTDDPEIAKRYIRLLVPSLVPFNLTLPLNETHREHISRISPRLSARVCVSFCAILPDTADKCLKNGGRCRD
ncbi:MAG: hypothetical protein WBG18_10750, partial [Xanthobacteraceae bacterium]